MAALPSGETFNEQMWVIFFALSKNDPSLNNISESTWIELYGQKDRSKFDKFLKERGIEWCVKNMPLDSRFNTADLKLLKQNFHQKKMVD